MLGLKHSRAECQLPPTYQSWFTITNLHVWLLTTRFRALPPHLGDYHVQALIDHFFLDVEARLRDVCATDKRVPLTSAPAPLVPPPLDAPMPKWIDTDEVVYLSPALASRRQISSYYVPRVARDAPTRKAAPETFITRQMKINREQYNGLTLALDLALAHDSDAEFASAIWRNFLGARGRNGIAYPGSDAEAVARARKEDGSFVYDFVDRDIDAYVKYPETMLTFVTYLRREIARLASIDDAAWISKSGDEDLIEEPMLFGPIQAVRK